jgi:hypothetical protein
MTTPLYSAKEYNAALAALQALVQADVPWYAQGQITPQLEAVVVQTILTAAAQARGPAMRQLTFNCPGPGIVVNQ